MSLDEIIKKKMTKKPIGAVRNGTIGKSRYFLVF